MPDMNLVITLDKNYLQHAGVMLRSLLESNPGTSFNLYIICDERMHEEDWKKLEEVYHGSPLNIFRIKIDPTIFEGFKLSEHASPANYYRIELGNLLPATVSKVLYLDVDIIINKPLNELYNTDISQYYLAAVEDPSAMHKAILGLAHEEPYFNSGIMLINLDIWRKTRLNKLLADFIINNPDKINYWDQDAFNALCKNKWKALSPCFNLQSAMYWIKEDAITYTQSDVSKCKANPVIIHYTGISKPWKFMDKHPRKKDYQKYLKLTPWKDFKPADASFANGLRKYGLIPGFMEHILKRK
jgi:lipopolysaccharide biosynthesis glycosyltransferase